MRPTIWFVSIAVGICISPTASGKAPCHDNCGSAGGAASYPVQYYTAWKYNPKRQQYECLYCYRPIAQTPKYLQMNVVYAPKNRDGYVYFYDRARRDFILRLPVPTGEAPPESGVWEMKGPDNTWLPNLAGIPAPIDTGEPLRQPLFFPDPNFDPAPSVQFAR